MTEQDRDEFLKIRRERNFDGFTPLTDVWEAALEYERGSERVKVLLDTLERISGNWSGDPRRDAQRALDVYRGRERVTVGAVDGLPPS